MAIMPLLSVHCAGQSYLMRRPSNTTRRSRRRFVQSGIAAAGLGLSGAADAWSKANVGERQLYLGIYRAGPGWLPDKPTNEQPLRDHGRYMLELYRQDCLKFAGAFADHSGGAAAFEAADDESARSIVAADPAVLTGVMTCTVQRWNLVDWASLVSATRATEQNP